MYEKTKMFQLLQAFFGSNKVNFGERRVVASLPDETKKSGELLLLSTPSSSANKKSKYDADVNAIETRFGSLNEKLNINTTLQEMLMIVPRNRKRVEAYLGLIHYLKKEYGVTLTITSRKNKTTAATTDN